MKNKNLHLLSTEQLFLLSSEQKNVSLMKLHFQKGFKLVLKEWNSLLDVKFHSELTELSS